MEKDNQVKPTADKNPAEADTAPAAAKKPANAKKKAEASTKKKAVTKKPATAKKTTAKKATAKKAAAKKPAAASKKAPAKKTAAKKTVAKKTTAKKAALKASAKAEKKPQTTAVEVQEPKEDKPKAAPKAEPEAKVEKKPQAAATVQETKEDKPEIKTEAKDEPPAEVKAAPAAKAEAKPAPKPPAPPIDDTPPAPPTETEAPDPIVKALKYAAAVFVALMLTVIGVSWLNSANYYLEPSDKALQIYRGSFSPMGKELLVSLPGVAAPKEIKDVYKAEEALVFAFDFYLKKADALIDVKKTPDFNAIKVNLNQALTYAVTEKMRTAAQKRLSFIDVMLLVYKADAAAGKQTIASVDTALGHLQQAAKIVVDQGQKELVAKRITQYEKLKADLTARQKLKPAAEKPAVAKEDAKAAKPEAAKTK